MSSDSLKMTSDDSISELPESIASLLFIENRCLVVCYLREVLKSAEIALTMSSHNDLPNITPAKDPTYSYQQPTIGKIQLYNITVAGEPATRSLLDNIPQ